MDVKVSHTYKIQEFGKLIQEIRVIYRMIESGASIVAVSKILGHADLKTTMRYAHPEDSLKDAVELLAKSSFQTHLLTNPLT